MERYKVGSDRDQISILPMSFDEMISNDNVVRALELIIDSMGLSTADFKYGTTAETGRKPYNPMDMFKLYVYSYFNGIRSSRKIERECHRNIEVMWLIHDLRPDHKTISEFRRNNKAGIRKAFRQFSLLCNDLGLVSKEFVAIDGSKFRASNSKDHYYSKGKISELIDHYTQAAERYLELLDGNDKADAAETVDLVSIRDRLDQATARIQELETIKQKVALEGAFCTTDPDAKNMVANNSGHDISYNVQIAVEPTSHIVLAVDTTNEVTDYKQLNRMAKQAKEVFGSINLTAVADRGYYSTNEFVKCIEDGIDPIVPKPLRGHGITPEYIRRGKVCPLHVSCS